MKKRVKQKTCVAQLGNEVVIHFTYILLGRIKNILVVEPVGSAKNVGCHCFLRMQTIIC